MRSLGVARVMSVWTMTTLSPGLTKLGERGRSDRTTQRVAQRRRLVGQAGHVARLDAVKRLRQIDDQAFAAISQGDWRHVETPQTSEVTEDLRGRV